MPLVIPTTFTPTLPDFLARVRLDLFDAGQRAGDDPRWTDGDLVRALDRANDAYSGVAPYFKESVIATFTGSRLYAMPADAWWIDAAEYPFGLWPRWYQAVEERISPFIAEPPASAGTVSLHAGGALSSGLYQWSVSFATPGGETLAVPLASATATSGQEAILSSIPIGPYGVIDRNIYRAAGDGSELYKVGSLGDNAATELTDGVADSALLSRPSAPAVNSTQGVRQLELQISDAKLPSSTNSAGQDLSYGWVGLRYAAKNELDANGTTIPERHHDALTLAACAAAVMAYLVPTADNFKFQDGQFRDQVDDSKVSQAWLAIGLSMEQRLQARLAEIRNEVNAGVAAIGSWGDKPLRWDRL